MNEFQIKKEYIKIISECQKEFENNLKNKKIIFIYENKEKTIGKEEMIFPTASFYHLTGIKAYDSNNKELNSYNFYNLLKNNGINASKIKIKDQTTYYKLQVLPQLMKIDKTANMIGNFTEDALFLQTDKIVGNVNACMGFVKNQKSNIYIPNTALKKDIRDITQERKKIVAILKKDINDKLYSNVTYLKQNYLISNILKNKYIEKIINRNGLHSFDKKIKLFQDG